ncbi:malate synthase [Micractinium conductrix]|uniref:Malate synthase n=1 Tax=Micractinium conductrix TaxID=554055 RepID=A0A2P6VMX6_9CHLO|nr:malate synthase [Micractinium conductrix]|eukprot:PSC75456.1 malate synthase [Micractinium conductrix]
MLGGVAGMQAKCGGYLGKTVNVKIGGKDFTEFQEGCDTTNTTAFVWWSVWFEFFLLILLSVAECGRVRGLYLTKQIFLCMVSVVMMVAADRSHVVISTWDGALQISAQVCMAGQLLHFGGELSEMRSVQGGGYGGDMGSKAAGTALPISATDLQMSGRAGADVNPFAIEFERLVAAGSAGTVVPPAAPESRAAFKSSKRAAAALDGDFEQGSSNM